MKGIAQAVSEGVSVSFKTTKYENPEADSDRRIVVKGLDFDRALDFTRELSALVAKPSVVALKGDWVVVDLPADSQMTKYELMDMVILALQKVGVNIGD